MTEAHLSNFKLGVDFGRMSAGILEPNGSDEARIEVLDAVLWHLAEYPNSDLIVDMTDAWRNYNCHGRLEPGQMCPACGLFRQEDDL